MKIHYGALAWWGNLKLHILWVARVLSKGMGLSDAFSKLIIHLVKGTGLFDRSYYLDTNRDIAQAGIFPLRHYVLYGDREDRQPMPLFDPVYYRSQVQGNVKRINALLHYAYVGRFRRISPCPWFDVDYYLANNKDIARAGIEPLSHYLKWGGLEGRSPSQQFDSAYYLSINPEVRASAMNPLLHYLLYGRVEGRGVLPQHGGEGIHFSDDFEIQQITPLDLDAWSEMTPRANVKQAVLDVIVPVYKGRAETLRCLYSVLSATCNVPFELVVIIDASPDADLTNELQQLATRGLFTLLSNHSNRGFVHTVNRGIAYHTDRDVIILNADAEVYDGWLERLRRAAERNDRTGTVTPLSNNATICSYPVTLHDNPFPLELPYSSLDKITSKINEGIEIQTPTGVGFCMYIKRACLNEVGLLDEKKFGKGYGEENDFCQRAIGKKWLNIVAADVFVRHLGSASFQGEKGKRIQFALKVLEKLYPNYHRDIAEFIRRDLLADARRRLDWARLCRMRRDKNVLIICHNRGGGTERHVQEDIQRLNQDGYGVFLLRPMQNMPSHVLLSHPLVKSIPNIPPIALSDVDSLREKLSDLGITEVHTHSLVDYVPEAPKYVSMLVGALGAYWEVNLHDYKVICPRINLIDKNGFYCGEPNDSECNKCLSLNGSGFNVLDIREWRAMHLSSLASADTVLVPDEDVAARMSRYFPEIGFDVSPHEVNLPGDMKTKLPMMLPGEKLRVVVIGAISKIKGYDILLACARDAKMYGLAVEFVVMGYSQNDQLLAAAGVKITGKYQDTSASDMLSKLHPHVVWIPSVWPETYSYTLSIGLKAGVPVAAFDIGAVARRLRESGGGHLLLPLEFAHHPQDVNHALLQLSKRAGLRMVESGS